MIKKIPSTSTTFFSFILRKIFRITLCKPLKQEIWLQPLFTIFCQVTPFENTSGLDHNFLRNTIGHLMTMLIENHLWIIAKEQIQSLENV